jgi:Fe-S cluster assembly protein SufB
MMGSGCGAITVPYIENKNKSSSINHEATTSKVSDEQLFYCKQRGLNENDATNMIVSGFCKEVFQKLPMEFAMEANKLLEVSMEGSVG